MCTQSLDVVRQTKKIASGEIDHLEIFSTQMTKLCMSEEFSDVTFEIENQKIPGHVNILATRSEYFRALLCGGFADSTQRVIQLKVAIEAFKALLTYIYSGHLSLSQMSEENIIDTLRFVNQCGCTELELNISEYLCEIVSLDNVCAIFDTARVLGLKKLHNVCYTFLDTNAYDVLVHESFKNLSEEAIKGIIRRDTFCAPEVQIFNAVSEWCKHNPNVPTESVVSLIRLPLMSFKELFEVVHHSRVLDSNSFFDAVKQKSTATSLPWRKGLWPEENVAMEKFGARVIEGECGSTLLDGDTTSCDMDKGYARHSITDDHNLGIIVELGSVTFINYIRLFLLCNESRCISCYSYFIDVSVNKTQWDRVVDHQSYHCSSWQFLYFPSRAVRYIKLVGTYGSKQPMFEVVSLDAYNTAEVPKMIDGIVAPKSNVASFKMGANVVPNNNTAGSEILLNGDAFNCDYNSPFTSHYIGEGSIMVKLGQPYVIGSMRILLNDHDYISYSYYIETSINQKDWEIVVDKRKEDCRSWQNLKFEPRAMVFIKIVGTKTSSSSNYFRCVHFECPSQILNGIGDKQEPA